MLSNYPKRTVVISVRMTVADREAIIARATRAGKSVSEYVRGAALHYATNPTPTSSGKPVAKFLSSADGRGGA